MKKELFKFLNVVSSAKKEIFEFLFAVSLGAWIISMFIATHYDNPIPMWILLIVMNAFNILKEIYNT